MRYPTSLKPTGDSPPILADFPRYVEPLCCDGRFLGTPLVGDVALATFSGSTPSQYVTQVALANAALTQMVTQVSWIRFVGE